MSLPHEPPPHNRALFVVNAPICAHCPRRAKSLCGNDYVPIIHHADAGVCPENRYPRNLPAPEDWDSLRQSVGLGDLIAAVLAKIGITPQAIEQATGRPCGCAERQAALNAVQLTAHGLASDPPLLLSFR